MPTKNEIEKSIKELLVRYNAEYALSAEKILKSQIYLHLPKNLGE